MPNNVKNIITFKGRPEDVEAVKAAIKGENYSSFGDPIGIDFNSIVRQPEGLEDDDKWYVWRIENWGTKWNAYDGVPGDNDNQLVFCTANACPFPIYNQIALICGNKVSFHVGYADEDLGYNCGTIDFEKGDELPKLCNLVEGSEEAKQFAADLWGWDLEELKE